MLAVTGNGGTAELLRGYIDAPQASSSGIAAVRALTGRQPGRS
jgi:hypothetical protein